MFFCIFGHVTDMQSAPMGHPLGNCGNSVRDTGRQRQKTERPTCGEGTNIMSRVRNCQFQDETGSGKSNSQREGG